MGKWIYYRVYSCRDSDGAPVTLDERFLNRMGSIGWEIVYIDLYYGHAVFKQRLEEK